MLMVRSPPVLYLNSDGAGHKKNELKNIQLT
jgi:hypothetical protein